MKFAREVVTKRQELLEREDINGLKVCHVRLCRAATARSSTLRICGTGRVGVAELLLATIRTSRMYLIGHQIEQAVFSPITQPC